MAVLSFPNHDVVMVVHDGVGTQINGKHRTHQLDAVHNPLATVFKIKAGYWIGTAQESTPHASGDAVVIRCFFDGDLAVSWLWHGVSLDVKRGRLYGKN